MSIGWQQQISTIKWPSWQSPISLPHLTRRLFWQPDTFNRILPSWSSLLSLKGSRATHSILLLLLWMLLVSIERRHWLLPGIILLLRNALTNNAGQTLRWQNFVFWGWVVRGCFYSLSFGCFSAVVTWSWDLEWWRFVFPSLSFNLILRLMEVYWLVEICKRYQRYYIALMWCRVRCKLNYGEISWYTMDFQRWLCHTSLCISRDRRQNPSYFVIIFCVY